jgi:hypothetical protein
MEIAQPSAVRHAGMFPNVINVLRRLERADVATRSEGGASGARVPIVWVAPDGHRGTIAIGRAAAGGPPSRESRLRQSSDPSAKPSACATRSSC